MFSELELGSEFFEALERVGGHGRRRTLCAAPLPARRRAADARRDRALGRLGYRVLRLPVELVRHRLAEAVALVAAALESYEA